MMSTVSRSSSGNVGGGEGRKRSLCAMFEDRVSVRLLWWDVTS